MAFRMLLSPVASRIATRVCRPVPQDVGPWNVRFATSCANPPSPMKRAERRARMRAQRRVVAGRNVFSWASDILEGLESLWTKPLHYSVRRWEDMSV